MFQKYGQKKKTKKKKLKKKKEKKNVRIAKLIALKRTHFFYNQFSLTP